MVSTLYSGVGDHDDDHDNLDHSHDFDHSHDSDGVHWDLRLGVERCYGPARKRMVWIVDAVEQYLSG